MTIRLRFKNSRLGIETSQLSDWLKRLKELHFFPDNEWARFSRPDRDAFQMPIQRSLDEIPNELGSSSSAQRHVERMLNEAFGLGYLIWPEGVDAERIRALKQNNPSRALQEMLQLLLAQRNSARQAVFDESADAQEIPRKLSEDPEFVALRSSVLDLREESRTLRAETIHRIEASKSELESAVRVSRETFEVLEQTMRAADNERALKFEEAKLSLQQSIDERNAEFIAAKEIVGQQSEAMKGRLETWLKDKQSEIDGAKEALRTSFATESAHTYWATTKFERHSKLASQTRYLGILYLVVLFVSAISLLVWGSKFSQPLWQTPLSVALPLVTLLVAAIWVGRLLAKTYMAHVQLAEDAQERATMIETYIALIRADVIDKSKAEEAQKALFRTAATGLLAGDSGPETPIEVVTKAISGGKS